MKFGPDWQRVFSESMGCVPGASRMGKWGSGQRGNGCSRRAWGARLFVRSEEPTRTSAFLGRSVLPESMGCEPHRRMGSGQRGSGCSRRECGVWLFVNSEEPTRTSAFLGRSMLPESKRSGLHGQFVAEDRSIAEFRLLCARLFLMSEEPTRTSAFLDASRVRAAQAYRGSGCSRRAWGASCTGEWSLSHHAEPNRRRSS
jgi:hypothetical protein